MFSRVSCQPDCKYDADAFVRMVRMKQDWLDHPVRRMPYRSFLKQMREKSVIMQTMVEWWPYSWLVRSMKHCLEQGWPVNTRHSLLLSRHLKMIQTAESFSQMSEGSQHRSPLGVAQLPLRCSVHIGCRYCESMHFLRLKIATPWIPVAPVWRITRFVHRLSLFHKRFA